MATNMLAREFRHLACQQDSGIKPSPQLIKRLGNSTYSANFTGSFIYGHGLWCIYLSHFWLWHLGTLFFPLRQVTSATRRSWATTASSSTRSRWRRGTAARREPCTASPSALTSSLCANLAGKVGPQLLRYVCRDSGQVWLRSVCTPGKRRCECLRAITKVCAVCVRACQPGCIVQYTCTVMGLCVFAHRSTGVIICMSLQPECVVLDVECIFFSQSPESHLSLDLPSIFLHLSVFFFFNSVLLSWPSSSPHSSPRNWPVKYSRRDQRHLTKSTMTQPAQLLAHQKAVEAALTRPTVMWRQVSTVSATTSTQAVRSR